MHDCDFNTHACDIHTHTGDFDMLRVKLLYYNIYINLSYRYKPAARMRVESILFAAECVSVQHAYVKIQHACVQVQHACVFKIYILI
jgi:hypothetical protein